MNRLQKKCIIVSAGLHLLLAIILIVGPAFLPSGARPDNLPTLNFVPVATVDAAISGGGNPAALPPAPAPIPPAAPPPQPVTPAPKPEPKAIEPVKVAPPEPPKIERPSPEALEPVKPHKHTIEISDKLVTTSASDIKTAANDAKAARARQAAKERADAKRRAAELNHALADLKTGLSPSTSIDLPGPGGGGVPYANFYTAVRTVYYNAWRQPDGVPEVTVKVSVTIARDGTVISARILTPSGNAAVDRSVQDTIDRVKFAAPLPENAKEDERTVPINFNIQAQTTG